MIKYDRLWETMREKGVTQYDLYTYHNVNRSQLDRLRKNKNVQTNTIDRLCNILHCNVEDIMEHIEDDNHFWNGRQKTTRAAGNIPAVFSCPNPLISAAAGLPNGGFFSFPHAEKCHALQKDLIQSRYKRDRNVILPLYHFLLESGTSPFLKNQGGAAYP